MKRTAVLATALFAAAALLSACGEKPQTNAEGVKQDAAPWSGTSNGTQKDGGTAFTAPGWKPGDKASWEARLKTRAQGQNEYVRMQ